MWFVLHVAVKNRCQPIKVPENGGLVCVGEASTNTERCKVQCNPDFEHAIRPNEYEECGPATNWHWSHEVEDKPILPCVGRCMKIIKKLEDYFY